MAAHDRISQAVDKLHPSQRIVEEHDSGPWKVGWHFRRFGDGQILLHLSGDSIEDIDVAFANWKEKRNG